MSRHFVNPTRVKAEEGNEAIVFPCSRNFFAWCLHFPLILGGKRRVRKPEFLSAGMKGSMKKFGGSKALDREKRSMNPSSCSGSNPLASPLADPPAEGGDQIRDPTIINGNLGFSGVNLVVFPVDEGCQIGHDHIGPRQKSLLPPFLIQHSCGRSGWHICVPRNHPGDGQNLQGPI